MTDEAAYREVESAFWRSLDVVPEERFVRLARTGTQIRVQEIGSGPPVLFVHGTANGGTSWAPLVVQLPDVRCLIVDRPGCVLSEPLAAPFADIAAFQRFADGFVAEVLDSLDIDHAPVVATSFGGHIAVRSAAATPDRIDRLVEFGYCFGASAGRVPLVMRLAAVGPLGRMMARVRPSRRTIRPLLRQIGLAQALAAGKLSDEFVDWFLAVLHHTDTMRNEVEVNPPLVNLRGLNPEIELTADLLGRVRCPVRILWGTGDPMGGSEVATPFAALLPDAALELIDDAGHAPWIDEPELAAAAVRWSLG